MENSTKNIELENIKNDLGLLNVTDVLPIFKVNEQTFRTWMKKGQLPQKLLIRIGNTYKVRKNILIQFLNGEVA